MEENMMGNGSMGNKMEKVTIQTQEELKNMENGSMEKELIGSKKIPNDWTL